MASVKTFVLVGFLNVIIFSIDMCFCNDFFCDIFEASLDSEVRGLLKCNKTMADYRFTLPPLSRYTEYYIKLNCISTDSEEIHSVIISPAHSEGYINYSSLQPPLTTQDLLEGTTCQLHGCINADRTRYWEIPGENCTIPFTGEGFRVIRSEDECSMKLPSYPERSFIAAKSGESHTVRLTRNSQCAVTQENVSLNIDCLSWLNQFPEGSIRWNYIQLYDLGNIEFKHGAITTLYPNTDVPYQRFVIGGDSNRWLNITETVVSDGTEDLNSEIFMCKVCTNHSNVSEMCHISNFTLYIIDASNIKVTMQSSLTPYQKVAVILSMLIIIMMCICAFLGTWIGIKGCLSRNYKKMLNRYMKENDYEVFDANSELVNIGIDQPNVGAKRCTSLSSLDTIQPLWKHLDIVDSDSDETLRCHIQDSDSQNYTSSSSPAISKCEYRSAIHFEDSDHLHDIMSEYTPLTTTNNQQTVICKDVSIDGYLHTKLL